MAIWIELNGGLGNQLFQYAFAKALSLKMEYPVFLNCAKNYSETSFRHLELDKFNITLPIKKYQHNPLHSVKLTLLDRLLCAMHLSSSVRKKHRQQKLAKYMQEEQAKYDKTSKVDEIVVISDDELSVNIENIKDNSYIIGFFQKPIYFDEIKALLVKEFTLSLPLSKENAQMLERIKQTKSVSVHIRRGDFLRHPNVAVLEKDYFIKAFDLMEKEIGSDFVIYVFTEDLEWAKENLSPKQEMVFVTINDGNNVVFDLELMKNCKHNILSNSTLAWWGGYLNENKNKIVIAPEIYMERAGNYNIDIHAARTIII